MHYPLKSTDGMTEICSIFILFRLKLSLSYITRYRFSLLRMTDISSDIATQINSFFFSLLELSFPCFVHQNLSPVKVLDVSAYIVVAVNQGANNRIPSYNIGYHPTTFRYKLRK